jgi:transposase
MPGGDIIMLSKKELRRVPVIHQVKEGKIRQVEAGRILDLSDRQIRRIVGRVCKEGEKGIAHRSRGKVSNRGFMEEVKEKVLGLYKERYMGFGPTLASEKLSEVEGIRISDETLRIWLKGSGIPYRGRKKRPHRQWRERKGHFGEMVQMDGSHHYWLEGRGPKGVLMGYIDDATGEVFAKFYDYEGTIPAMDSFHRYIKLYGIPQSVYLDKHTTYKSNAKPSIEDDLNGRKPMSQFERALDELGVKVIHAHSPQAKEYASYYTSCGLLTQFSRFLFLILNFSPRLLIN